MSLRLQTRAIHGGQPNDPRTGSVTTPIYQSSTFEQDAPGVTRGFCYARTDHPTRLALEESLAALEDAKHGLAFASGMAAINAALTILSSGDHVVSSRDLYGGAWRIFTKLYSKFGIEFTFVDTTDPEEVLRAIRPSTRLLWLETPSNPLLKITDISACAAIARQHGVRTVVDNTFATPCLQRPLERGADLVVHSTTKYIGGHSDVLGGALITNDDILHAELKFFQNAVGAVPGPQDCFLLLRGIKTLPLRVAAHCAGALRIVESLREHSAVRRIHFPSLPSHPGHEVAARQMSGFGSIISIELDASVEETVAFIRRLRLWTLAESLGGVKSLLCHPPTMTHAAVEPEVRREVGIADGLIRLSVGLEDPLDLIDDLEQALDSLQGARRESTEEGVARAQG